VEFIYAQRLTEYRLDIEQGESFWRGKSLFTQLNVSRRDNYKPEAWGKLKGLYVVSILRLIAALAFIVILGRYMFANFT